MVERLPSMQEAMGSIPSTTTKKTKQNKQTNLHIASPRHFFSYDPTVYPYSTVVINHSWGIL